MSHDNQFQERVEIIRNRIRQLKDHGVADNTIQQMLRHMNDTYEVMGNCSADFMNSLMVFGYYAIRGTDDVHDYVRSTTSPEVVAGPSWGRIGDIQHDLVLLLGEMAKESCNCRLYPHL